MRWCDAIAFDYIAHRMAYTSSMGTWRARLSGPFRFLVYKFSARFSPRWRLDS
jgi:hypothetical protein